MSSVRTTITLPAVLKLRAEILVLECGYSDFSGFLHQRIRDAWEAKHPGSFPDEAECRELISKLEEEREP